MIPKVPYISYSRPLPPSSPGYTEQATLRERELARALQLHQCDERCEAWKKGKKRCIRKAPWPVSETDRINAGGAWRPRRSYGYLNNWNPTILQTILCNHDMKLITNGEETKDITFYITNYTAKKQKKTSNSSAVLATRVASHSRQERRNDNILDVNRKLLNRCANSLSREQEFSGPEVVSYLMGWGDRFLSHQYVPIYWDSAVSSLRATFPEFRVRRHFTIEEITESGTTENREEDEYVRIRMVNGTICLHDQLRDYAARGVELEEMNLMDFYINTYDGAAAVAPQETSARQARGGPHSQRVPYLASSERDHRCCIVRRPGHEMIPQFIGKWFPRRDRPETEEFYSANMLMLLKPWRYLKDLAVDNQSFSTSRVTHLDNRPKLKRTMDNIQYYYECFDAAKENRSTTDEDGLANDQPIDETIGEDDHTAEFISEQEERTEPTEVDIQSAMENSWLAKEVRFGEIALGVAEDVGIFDFSIPPQPAKVGAFLPTEEEYANFTDWDAFVQNITRHQHDAAVAPPQAVDNVLPSRDDFTIGNNMPVTANVVDVSILKPDQRRAYNIVTHHLDASLNRSTPPQLLMIVQGQGGTGKSMLISKITENFGSRSCSHLLSRTATTGVAASLINGQTLHSWAGIPRGGGLKPPGKATREKRAKNIGTTRYLIIDEFSMLTKEILCILSQILGEYYNDEEGASSTTPFGNISVILFGDPHQFPPVTSPKSSLFDAANTNQRQQLGRKLFEQFQIVVTLGEQIRIRDLVWNALLGRLRTGDCTENDLAILRSLVVTSTSCQLPSFQSSPWSEAVLITMRHCVREQWNMAGIARHCIATGNQVYRFCAEDYITMNNATPTQYQRLAIASMRPKQTGNLTYDIHLAVGMKIMVTMNIVTEADLANGARGTVEKIVLDPRDAGERLDPTARVVTLRHPPVMILFRPYHATFPAIPGLPPGTIPIFPSQASFTVNETKFTRRQMAVTGAYAFTDYKSQGQTLEHVIVDLARPPMGKLTPFHAYVALSRSRGRDTIRLLRDFDDLLFIRHPSAALEVEDVRLEDLARTTLRKHSDNGNGFLW